MAERAPADALPEVRLDRVFDRLCAERIGQVYELLVPERARRAQSVPGRRPGEVRAGADLVAAPPRTASGA